MKKLSLRNKNILFLTIIYIGGFFNLIDTRIVKVDSILIRHVMFAIGTLYFFFQFIKANQKNLLKALLPNLKNSKIIIVWLLFATSISLAQIINQELPTTGLLYILISFYLLMYLIPSVIEKPLEAIFTASFFSTLFYVVISLLVVSPFEIRSYKGILLNSNQMGLIASILLFSTLVKMFLIKKSTKNLFIKISMPIITILSIALLLLSQSRTAFVASLLTFLITLFLLIKREKLVMKNYLLPTLITGTLFTVLFKDLFVVRIWDKFVRKIGAGSLTDGRFEFWLKVVKDRKIFGFGRNYFYFTKQTAHNVFINFLGTYGILPVIFIAVFFIMTILKAYNFLRSKDNDLSVYIPLVFIIFFLQFNITENVFGVMASSLTLMFYNTVGVIIKNELKERF